MLQDLSAAEMPMRNVINALTLKFKSLSDDDVVRLTHAAELERRAIQTPDKWQAVLAALRPRLNDLRPPRMPSLTRQFFQPVEDFLVSGRRGEKRPGQIDRSSLMPIWQWLSESSAGPAICIAQSHFAKDGSEPRPEEIEVVLQPVRTAARDAIVNALEGAEYDTKKARLLAASLGGVQALEDLREFALALSVSQDLLDLQSALDVRFDVVTSRHIEIARASFRAIDSVDPDASYFVPMVFLGRLSQPWEVLRLTAAVSRVRTEELLMSTDFRVVCDRLLDLLREQRQLFEHVPDTDADQLTAHLRTFVDIYSGISQVIPIKKHSELGGHLLECRNGFTDQIAIRVESLSRFIHASIPVDYSAFETLSPSRPAHLPDFDSADLSAKVTSMADFIVQVSRLSHKTNLYFGIDQDVKTLNAALNERLIALTLAYRQSRSIPSEVLDQYYDVLASAFCKLAGSESVDRLKTVKP